MIVLALGLALAIIVFAAGFHLHWAFGGKRGFDVSLPQHPDGRPIHAHLLPLWRAGALAVALVLLAIGVLALAQAGIVRLPIDARMVRGALLIAATIFIIRALAWSRYVGLFKTLRGTRWARYDTRLYCPLILTLGLSLLYLAAP